MSLPSNSPCPSSAYLLLLARPFWFDEVVVTLFWKRALGLFCFKLIYVPGPERSSGVPGQRWTLWTHHLPGAGSDPVQRGCWEGPVRSGKTSGDPSGDGEWEERQGEKDSWVGEVRVKGISWKKQSYTLLPIIFIWNSKAKVFNLIPGGVMSLFFIYLCPCCFFVVENTWFRLSAADRAGISKKQAGHQPTRPTDELSSAKNAVLVQITHLTFHFMIVCAVLSSIVFFIVPEILLAPLISPLSSTFLQPFSTICPSSHYMCAQTNIRVALHLCAFDHSHTLEIPPPLICGVLSNQENKPLLLLAHSSQWGGWCGTTWAREWLVATRLTAARRTHLACCRTGYDSTAVTVTMWKSLLNNEMCYGWTWGKPLWLWLHGHKILHQLRLKLPQM